MGWDSSALILAQIFVSAGLIERYKEGKHLSDGFIEGYKTAMEERVVDKYWGSDESGKLGDVLFQDIEKGQQTEIAIYEIREAIEIALMNASLHERDADRIEACRSRLVKILNDIRHPVSGEAPIKELDNLIKRLEKHERP